MSPRRIAQILFGSLFALVGVAFLAASAALGWGLAFERDSDGYFTTPTERFTSASASHAITTEQLDLGEPGPDHRWADRLATIRVRASAPPEAALFIGIGRERDVEAYLADVRHDEIVDVRFDPFVPEFRPHHEDATTAPAAPTTQSFWVAQATSAPGRISPLVWEVEPGEWTMVVMNADGRAGVTTDIELGAKLPWLFSLSLILGALGLLGLVGAVALLVLGTRGSGEPGPVTQSAAGRLGPDVAPAFGQSPVMLTGVLDPGVSRWKWLVKWFLAIPHFVVLCFLWAAFGVLTFVAFFAIVFTGRYPQSIFRFNVGVMRWSWRVGFYANSALGTDRYPPFSLHDRSYPADLDVVFPQHLSRGLVFVKSWLLAIPHLIIVGILTSSQTWSWGWGGTWQGDNARWSIGGGLIGILSLIAGVALLFTGKYPRGLFDIIMGLNRWVYRVIAYVALMTDTYPPFRLDQGPTEPTPEGPTGPTGRTPTIDAPSGADLVSAGRS